MFIGGLRVGSLFFVLSLKGFLMLFVLFMQVDCSGRGSYSGDGVAFDQYGGPQDGSAIKVTVHQTDPWPRGSWSRAGSACALRNALLMRMGEATYDVATLCAPTRLPLL